MLLGVRFNHGEIKRSDGRRLPNAGGAGSIPGTGSVFFFFEITQDQLSSFPERGGVTAGRIGIQ